MFEPPRPWEDILDFWLGPDRDSRDWPDEATAKRWFRGGPALDAEISERFGPLVEAALGNELVGWEAQPESRLALILLLDQFTRNIYRGKARAFDGDHRAQTLVQEGLALNLDASLPWAGRVFFLMPLMHAEDEGLQDRSVACFERLHEQAPPAVAEHIADNLKHARQHRETIQRFGRFPHRNKALGRRNTAEEEAFLRESSSFGQ